MDILHKFATKLIHFKLKQLCQIEEMRLKLNCNLCRKSQIPSSSNTNNT